MSQSPSTLKVIGLVLLASLIGGLLLAQVEAPDEKAAPASPSDKPAVAEEAKAEEASEVTSEAEVQAIATPPEAAPDVVPDGDLEPAPAPTSITEPAKPGTSSKTDVNGNVRRVIASLTIFVLAVFVGFEVITKVPPTLHTPLMSGSNAISGITLVGAVIVAASISFSGFVGFIAVTLATVNAVGGFMVTHRMLAMFKKR